LEDSVDFFQEGVSYKEVSSAQVDNIISVCDRDAQALWSEAAMDWSRNDINRYKTQLMRVKEELRFVLSELGIDPLSVEVFRNIINDDVVPDSVSDTSDKTNYGQVRYRNYSLENVTELYSVLKGATGSVLNRVNGLVAEVSFIRLKIAKAEADMVAKTAARKEFSQKRDKDKDGFKTLRGQYLALSEILGYVVALIDIVGNFPKATSSSTSATIRSSSETFDLLCWKWRRYRGQLTRAVEHYISDYSDLVSPQIKGDFADSDLAEPVSLMSYYLDIGFPFDKINEALKNNFSLVYNKSKKQYELLDRNFVSSVTKMKELISGDKFLPTHYTQVTVDLDSVLIV
jgi:hypothetical protein